MATITGTIPNVIGGISQQPPAARLENTAGDLKNAVPSVVSGLRKRPPLRWISDLIPTPTSTIAVFEWVRTGKPTKFVVIADGTVKVFNQDGSSETVTNVGSATDYIASSPRPSMGFMAVGDTLFIYNKGRYVAKTNPSDSRTDPKRYFTFVLKQSSPKMNYRVIADGVTGSYYQGTDPMAVEDICQPLTDDYNTNYVGSDPALKTGNIVSILFPSATSGTFRGYPTPFMTSYRDELSLFTNLPQNERDGRMVRITGDDGAVDASYWVQYDNNTHSWSEVVGYGAKEELDPSTMPHVLVDDGDGTWTFKEHTWPGREAGDATSNPTPSFVGQQIKDMFLTANRMVILADENVIASEVGEYENFYRTTCTTVLDSDRLDVAALTTDDRVARLYSAVEFNGGILLFSDRNQFVMETKNGLSPNTVNLAATTSFLASPYVSPVKLGTNVLFVDDSDDSAWADLREYLVDDVVGVNTSEVITKQVPELIPTGVNKLIPNATLGLALAFSTSKQNRIYVYSYYMSNAERIQSAWSYWEDTDVSYVSGKFVGNTLYVTFIRDGKLCLGKMDLQETLTGDVDGLEIMLDYRVTDSDVSVSFDGSDSTVTLPYKSLSGNMFTAVLTADGVDVKGTAYNGEPSTTNQIVFRGIDLTGQTFVIGKKYEFLYEISPVFLRDDKKVPIQDGRLQLRYMSFLYHRSSYFRVEVTPIGRSKFTETFTGRTMGKLTDVVGAVAVADGEFSVACSGQPIDTLIQVINDSPFNCRFSSIEWRGSWRGRTTRT